MRGVEERKYESYLKYGEYLSDEYNKADAFCSVLIRFDRRN